MSEFADKVVLVTGAGRAIGRAIALAFAGREAIVAVQDITPLGLDKTLALIQEAGGRSKDYLFDLVKKMPVQSLVSQVLADWGRIDILVNNAAVEPAAALLEMDEWDWHRTLDVNLGGPFLTMQVVGRVMRQQGGGVVVNVASATGRAGGVEGRAAYVASMMGLIGLTRTAALELAPYNIRVNAVCPGLIAEGMTTEGGRALDAALAGGLPLGRAGSAQEVAEVVLFLCSAAAAYITGQAINVDGGLVMS
ncbi:MAG: SDR family oxidoreductase [Anaerolineales bacterium]|nr:SDR family oxidoreductase [Anaerolineales bacterium]